MRGRLMTAVILLTLLVAACGDDGGSVFDQGGPTSTSGGEETTTTGGEAQTTTTAAATTEATTTTAAAGDEQALIDEIADQLLAQNATGGDLALPIDEESARCVAGQVVSTFGVERLQELSAGGASDLGAAMEQMTPEEQATMVRVILRGAEGQEPCIDVRAFFVDTFTQSGLSQGSAECVADALLGGSVFEDLMAAALAGEAEDEMPPEVLGQLMTVMMGCLTPEELGELGGGLGG